MGIQENVRRREAKLAAQAQAEMQATHEEQPQAAPSESKVQPMFDTSALRQSIRAEVREVVHAELQASRPEPFDTEALRHFYAGCVILPRIFFYLPSSSVRLFTATLALAPGI